MSSMPMHIMTIVAALALLTVAFVMSYKKKSKSEDYPRYRYPRTDGIFDPSDPDSPMHLLSGMR